MPTIVKSLNPVRNPTLYALTGELQDALARIEPNPETGELERLRVKKSKEAQQVLTEGIFNMVRKNRETLFQRMKK